jgi:hypothetical protein
VLNRRSVLFALASLPAALLSAQFPSDSAMKQIAERWKREREQTEQLNDLAGNIHSLNDARALVDKVADQFSDQLPPRWSTRGIRNRIAKAEYESAADPGVLIPEKQIADAWDDYIVKIGGPQEALVTAEEIHYSRDSLYTTSKMLWTEPGARNNIWIVPNIYAIGPEGKVADGCRAIEALRVLWDIQSEPGNLNSVRLQVGKGVTFSEEMRQAAKMASAGQGQAPSGRGEARMEVRLEVISNPVDAAERRYVKEHGMIAFDRAVEGLLSDLFPR